MDYKSRGLLGRLNCKTNKLGTFIYIPYCKIQAISEHRKFLLEQQISNILTHIWYQNVRNNQRPEKQQEILYRLISNTFLNLLEEDSKNVRLKI